MKQEFELYLKHSLDKREDYKEALELTKINSSGQIYLFGGGVYRILSNYPHKNQIKLKDYDFLVEEINFKIRYPGGWEKITGNFSNPKFRNNLNGLKLDIVPIDNIYHIKKSFLEPSVESFLSVAPLNIFSLVYNIKDRKLIGDIGLEGISQRIVKVNNLKCADEMAKLYHKSIEQIIEEKAKALNFKAEYPLDYS